MRWLFKIFADILVNIFKLPLPPPPKKRGRPRRR